MTDAPPEDRTTALMLSLALGLVQAAYMQLGKIRNEMTGKIERDLAAARVTIDTLAALETRTRGNRSESETQMFERALAELRLNYVDEMKKSAAEATASAAAAAPAMATTPEPPPTPDA